MNYLITGGSGFIGSHLIENLLKKYYEVRFEPNKTEERDLIISKFIELIEK